LRGSPGDRLRHPIDPEGKDGYGSAWQREWDGRRYHTREHPTAAREPVNSDTYSWAVEYDHHCTGSAGLHVDTGQHCASYAAGLFVTALRGRGLGREVTRLVLSWGFDVLGLHRIQLEVLAANSHAINCCLACGSAKKKSSVKPSYTQTAGKPQPDASAAARIRGRGTETPE
jgi:RimJ/RimL family protein N-acetyltransferase